MLKRSEKRLYAWLENPLTPCYLLSTLPSCPVPPSLPSPTWQTWSLGPESQTRILPMKLGASCSSLSRLESLSDKAFCSHRRIHAKGSQGFVPQLARTNPEMLKKR